MTAALAIFVVLIAAVGGWLLCTMAFGSTDRHEEDAVRKFDRDSELR